MVPHLVLLQVPSLCVWISVIVFEHTVHLIFWNELVMSTREPNDFLFFFISRISNSGWPFWILWKQVLWLGEALCHQQRDKACRVCLHGHLQTALQTRVWIWWGILWKPLWSAQSCLPEKAKDHHRSQWRLLF